LVGWINLKRRKVITFRNEGENVKIVQNLRFFIIILFLVELTMVFAVIDEETARSYFSQTLEYVYSGDFKSAYEYSKKAMSGRVYVQELPYFWYLRGRLGIINGEVDKAIQELRNYTSLVRNDDIENLIQRVDYFRKLNLSPSNSFIMSYINSVKGSVKGIEYFQTPTSLTVYGDQFVVLDSKNKRIVYFKNSKILKIKKISKDIKQVFFDRNGDLYLLGGKSLYDEKEQELINDLQVPLVAGSDRKGNIYIVDFDRVVKYNTVTRKPTIQKLNQKVFALDAEITVDRLYVLDALKQMILVFKLETLEKIQEISLPEKIWSFEVTPYGDIIYLGKDKVVANNYAFPVKDVDFIEYSYPTLFLIKWKGNTIDEYVLKDDKPLFVNIKNVTFDENYAYAYFSVEDLYGDELHYIKYAIGVFEHDVYVPTEIYPETMDVSIQKVDKCIGELITYRLMDVRVIGDCPILTKLTGSVREVDNAHRKKLYWVAKWAYLRPVPPGIIKLTAKVSIKEQVFYDTMFYTEKLMRMLLEKSKK